MTLKMILMMAEMERKMSVKIYMKTQPVEGHTSNLSSNRTFITQSGLATNSQIGSVLTMASMQEASSYTSAKML